MWLTSKRPGLACSQMLGQDARAILHRHLPSCKANELGTSMEVIEGRTLWALVFHSPAEKFGSLRPKLYGDQKMPSSNGSRRCWGGRTCRGTGSGRVCRMVWAGGRIQAEEECWGGGAAPGSGWSGGATGRGAEFRPPKSGMAGGEVVSTGSLCGRRDTV